jgi:two-component sensor histidine kinase
LKKERNLAQLLFVTILGVSIIPLLAFEISWISIVYFRYKNESERSKIDFIDVKVNNTKQRINELENYIEYVESGTLNILKGHIKDETYEAYNIASNLYDKYNKIKPLSEIKDIVKEVLRPIRYNNGRGYYFATELTGIEQLFADKPELEGKDLLNMKSSDGKYVIRDMIKIAAKEGEGFYEYQWTKPGVKGNDHLKIAYIKYFKPFNWFVGTGEYFEDIENDLKKESLDRISSLNFGRDEYTFVIDSDGVVIYHPDKDLAGKNINASKDPSLIKFAKELPSAKNSPEGIIVTYFWDKYSTGKKEFKSSYVKYLKDWKWYIASGIYSSEYDRQIFEKRRELVRGLTTQAVLIFILFAGIFLICYLIVYLFSKKIRREMDIFTAFFTQTPVSMKKIDPAMLTLRETKLIAKQANMMIEEKDKIENNLRKNRESLLKSLNEKEILLKEIHHRVKNNLQLVCSLLGMKSLTTKNPEIAAAFKESENRIRTMAFIHETLYQSKDFTKIEFGRFIDNLIGYLFDSYGSNASDITKEIKAEKIFFDLDIAIPLGLMITEIVTNSIKYAFGTASPEKKIFMYINGKKDDVTVVVGDNGNGMTRDIDIADSKTLGLKLINALSEQIYAVLEIKTNPGTVYTLKFKYPKK